MLVVRNDDRPGMIGTVGVVLGDAGISISSMAVGPEPPRRPPPSWCSRSAGGPRRGARPAAGHEGILDLHRTRAVGARAARAAVPGLAGHLGPGVVAGGSARSAEQGTQARAGRQAGHDQQEPQQSLPTRYRSRGHRWAP